MECKFFQNLAELFCAILIGIYPEWNVNMRRKRLQTDIYHWNISRMECKYVHREYDDLYAKLEYIQNGM